MDNFEAVNQSFARCGQSDGFYDTFYEVFLAKLADIPPLFAKTDFKKQKQILKATAALMVNHQLHEEKVSVPLEKVRKTHSRDGYNIRPDLYPLWLDSLCETVKQHDPEFSRERERQWRMRMSDGINFIASGYERRKTEEHER